MSSPASKTLWDVLPSIGDTLSQAGLAPDRRLGQNFLMERGLLSRIAGVAGDLSGQNIVEIGPGPGGLTRSILDAGAASLIAIERDERCLGILQELAGKADGRLVIHHRDALDVDWNALTTEPYRVIANLPYNIGTKLIVTWLRHRGKVQSITVLVQKEVAQRLTARPGTKSWGRLAVRAQWDWQVQKCFDVSAKAFIPPPKVTSSVVHFIPRPEPLFQAPLALLEQVTAAAFQQRRKMLRQSLKSLSPEAIALCEEAGLSPELRADAVDIEGYCALANALKRMRSHD